MKYFTDLEQFPSNLPPTYVTIGNFDGVHLGHQQILNKIVAQAREQKGASVVITFDPHPLRILLPESAPPLIMTPAQKLQAFAECGIEYGLVLHFNEEMARLSPRQFIETILVKHVATKGVLVGSNFVFGYQQRGNVETLKSLGKEFNFAVNSVPQYTWRRTRVSSTLIRGFIREGQITEANRLLGRFFTLEGGVIHGTGRGRRLTVPTLNLATENELIPKSGVYITKTLFNGSRFSSVTNIGVRPTFNELSLSIETHLIDLSEIKTPDRISISFLHRLRNEKKFLNANELKEQITHDIKTAKQYFGRLNRFTSR